MPHRNPSEKCAISMNSDSFKSALLAAATQALRPVTRLMLASGVTFREFSALAKRVFVSVASDEFGRSGRPTNISRVSLMTGLARKDVRRLRNELEGDESLAPPPQKTTEATRLLSAWYELEEYTNADGTPRAIPPGGPAPSFEALHRKHGGDIPATTMQKDLVRTGALCIESDGKLKPLRRYFMPLPLEVDAVARAGDVLLTMGNTVTLNLTRRPGSEGRFEGRASSTRIPARDTAEFRAFVERQGMRFLEEMDQWLNRHAVEPDSSEAELVRLGVGVYQIQEAEDVQASTTVINPQPETSKTPVEKQQ